MGKKWKKMIIDGKEVDPRIHWYAPENIHKMIIALREDGEDITEYLNNAFERYYAYPRFMEKLCHTNVDNWSDDDILYWREMITKIELVDRNYKIEERYGQIVQALQKEIEEERRSKSEINMV